MGVGCCFVGAVSGFGVCPVSGEDTRAAVFALAHEVLGEAASRWLTIPNVDLGGVRPVDLLGDREGCRRVFALLLAIAEGVTA